MGALLVLGNFFVADGSALAADTVTLPVNQSFTLENGVTVTLTNYTSNALGQRIYFTLEAVPPRNAENIICAWQASMI